jgi:hypothetical protein
MQYSISSTISTHNIKKFLEVLCEGQDISNKKSLKNLKVIIMSLPQVQEENKYNAIIPHSLLAATA